MWETVIGVVKTANDRLNSIVWGWPTIILILGTGILLTIRTKIRFSSKRGGNSALPAVFLQKITYKTDKIDPFPLDRMATMW